MQIYSFLWLGELEAGEEGSPVPIVRIFTYRPMSQNSEIFRFRKVIRHITEF